VSDKPWHSRRWSADLHRMHLEQVILETDLDKRPGGVRPHVMPHKLTRKPGKGDLVSRCTRSRLLMLEDMLEVLIELKGRHGASKMLSI
jgi:hypothetical protein